jgi:hypothetical protein
MQWFTKSSCRIVSSARGTISWFVHTKGIAENIVEDKKLSWHFLLLPLERRGCSNVSAYARSYAISLHLDCTNVSKAFYQTTKPGMSLVGSIIAVLSGQGVPGS